MSPPTQNSAGTTSSINSAIITSTTTPPVKSLPTKPYPIFTRTPGSATTPISPVLLAKGATAKTASTARKTASNVSSPVATAPEPTSHNTPLAKSKNRGRLPSEEGSSSSTSSTKSKSGSSFPASHVNSSAASKLRKPKRKIPQNDDDDIVMSDIPQNADVFYNKPRTSSVTARFFSSSKNDPQSTGKIASAVVPPSADTHAPSEAAMPPPAAPSTANTATSVLTSTSMPPGVSSPTPERVAKTRSTPSRQSTSSPPTSSRQIPMPPPSKRQKRLDDNSTSSRIANTTREVITIDSDDEMPLVEPSRATPSSPIVPPAAIPQEGERLIVVDNVGQATVIPAEEDESKNTPYKPMTPSASTSQEGVKLILVNNAGQATVMPAEEAKYKNFPEHPPTSFSQRVKIITAQLKEKENKSLQPNGGRAPSETAADTKSVKSVPLLDSNTEQSTENMSEEKTNFPFDTLASQEPLRKEVTISTSRERLDQTNTEPSVRHITQTAEYPVHGTPTAHTNILHNPSDTAQAQLNLETSTAGLVTPPHSDSAEGISSRVKDRSLSNSEKQENLRSQSANVGVVNNPGTQMGLNFTDLRGIRAELVRTFIELEEKYARDLREQAQDRISDRFYVNDEFFQKCSIAAELIEGELESMVIRLEHTIFTLYEEASQYIINNQFYHLMPGVLLRGRIDNYFLEDKHKLSLLERLQVLLKEITVMTYRQEKVTFDHWITEGKNPLGGKVVLSTQSILDLVETHKRVSAEIEAEATSFAANSDDNRRDKAGGHCTQKLSENNAAAEQKNTPLQPLSPPHSPADNGHLRAVEDVEMKDADTSILNATTTASEGNRRNSLIIKLPAPATILRRLNESLIENRRAVTTAILKDAPSITPIPNPPGTSARSRIKKSAGTSQYNDIIKEMHHFGESRMEAINATVRERSDPYLIRIRELDAEREKIRLELRRVSEEATKKSREYDDKLNNLLLEADFLDERTRCSGLGANGFLPPERDLAWEQYQRLVQEKADHETDAAAAREKLVRRGICVSEEKKRIVRMQEESLKWEKQMEAIKEARRMELLVLDRPVAMAHLLQQQQQQQRIYGEDSSFSSTSNTAPSTRAPSAAIGATAGQSITSDVVMQEPAEQSASEPSPPVNINDKPIGEPLVTSDVNASSSSLTSSSSRPSSVFSVAAEDSSSSSTGGNAPAADAAAAKASIFELGKVLAENVTGGYAALLLAGIRDSALLPDSEERPPPMKPPFYYTANGVPVGLEGFVAPKKKKPRPRKGW